jgi:hypothetical protein
MGRAMTFLSLILSGPAHAVPLQLTQQGRLLDPSGASVAGLHDLHFRIYDDASAGSLLWDESLTVDFVNGYYAAVLGADEALNPLDGETLSLFPLYMELEVDGNGPMAPRQAMTSAPYAQMAGTAENLEGGTVDATSVSIGGIQVIDSAGSWTGTLSVDWGSQLANIPGDIADGDDNTQLSESQVEGYITNGALSMDSGTSLGGKAILTEDTAHLDGLSCSAGELAGWNGADWVCVSDGMLDEQAVEDAVTNGAIDLHVDTTIGGSPILTQADDQDTMAALGLTCLDDGDQAIWEAAAQEWYCGSSEIPLQGLACDEGDTPVYESGLWICSSDASSGGGGSTYHFGNFTISSTFAMEAFCQQFTGVIGELILTGSELENVDALSCLDFVEGSLRINSAHNLQNLDGLSSLTRVTGDFNISNNHSLESTAGLSALQQVGGYLYIESVPLLTDAGSFSSLQSVGSYLEFANNQSLQTVSGFDSLETVDGYVKFSANNAMTAIDGFGSLQSIGGDLEFYNCDGLTAVSGFGALESIGGWLEFRYNDILATVSGFGNLQTITGQIYIQGNDVLGTFDGLQSLESTEALYIVYNPLLTDITEIASGGGAQSISGTLAIYGNTVLPSAQAEALRDLFGSSNIGAVEIYDND